MITYYAVEAQDNRCHCIVIRARAEFTQLVSLCTAAKLAALKEAVPLALEQLQ